MNEPDELALATAIESAVRSMTGVAAVYRPGSMLSKAVATGARLLGMHDADTPLVRVELAGNDPRVEAAIGVRTPGNASEIACTAYDAILAQLVGHGVPDAEVHLTVVHIDDRDAEHERGGWA